MTPKRFGQIVRARAKYYGVGFKELAYDAKCSKATLSRIWNGKGNPTLNTMNRIAERLFFSIRTDY